MDKGTKNLLGTIINVGAIIGSLVVIRKCWKAVTTSDQDVIRYKNKEVRNKIPINDVMPRVKVFAQMSSSFKPADFDKDLTDVANIRRNEMVELDDAIGSAKDILLDTVATTMNDGEDIISIDDAAYQMNTQLDDYRDSLIKLFKKLIEDAEEEEEDEEFVFNWDPAQDKEMLDDEDDWEDDDDWEDEEDEEFDDELEEDEESDSSTFSTLFKQISKSEEEPNETNTAPRTFKSSIENNVKPFAFTALFNQNEDTDVDEENTNSIDTDEEDKSTSDENPEFSSDVEESSDKSDKPQITPLDLLNKKIMETENTEEDIINTEPAARGLVIVAQLLGNAFKEISENQYTMNVFKPNEIGGTFDIRIEWGDGSKEAYHTEDLSSITHIYSDSNTKPIKFIVTNDQHDIKLHDIISQDFKGNIVEKVTANENVVKKVFNK